MIRHDEPGISVRISDEGLRRAANDNQLKLNASGRHRWYVEVAGWVAAIGLGLLLAYSAANGS